MIKQMTAKQLAKWQNEVTDYARRMTAKFDINEAAARVWRFYGVAAEIKNGQLVIWFGHEAVQS